ncbi:AMP-binding enzyme, partial [Gelidibacter salicanalis]|nr:hypothetical protein [Gelidibacter salicanalis]
ITHDYDGAVLGEGVVSLLAIPIIAGGTLRGLIYVAGHRLSTGSLEEVLSQHPDVAECAVLGLHDELKGQRAAGFITMKHGRNRLEH